MGMGLVNQASARCARQSRQGLRQGCVAPRKVGAKHRKTEKELPLNADGNVPFDEAVKFITGQEKLHIKPRKEARARLGKV